MQKENASGDLVIFGRFSYLCTAGRIANPKVQPGVLLEPWQSPGVNGSLDGADCVVSHPSLPQTLPSPNTYPNLRDVSRWSWQPARQMVHATCSMKLLEVLEPFPVLQVIVLLALLVRA